MTADRAHDLQALLTKLSRLHGLSGEDRAAIERLPFNEALVATGHDIVRAGDHADRCAIILEGVASSYKLTGDGQRQILCLHLAGDMPDLQSLHFGTTDTGVVAMGRCHVGYVPYDALNKLCSVRPSLTAVLWRETLLQAAIVREGLLNVGRRNGMARLGHLLCEMVVRHRAAGLASNYACTLPLTQVALADALGLSAVHVNRMVQELRRERLIELDGRQLTVTNWNRLTDIADFDSAYLHLDRGSHLS